MKLLQTLALVSVLVLPGQAFALSAADFLAPAQAETPEEMQAATQIQNPGAVKMEKGFGGEQAVAAATAQDAINAAVDELEEIGNGCQQIRFPSGWGWVASGTGFYQAMPNPVATLQAQRIAYQKAYLQARKELTQTLYGLSTEGKEALSSEIATLNTDTESLANASDTMTERITERIKGLIRGYVVYNVKDEQNAPTGTVTVTIVTTPKTMGRFDRIDPSSLSAESVTEGLQSVFNELTSNLMPPVGGKTITVPQTGEIAFVAYGSAIVQPNQNPGVAQKLRANAQKVATMRARSALCGIILGDEVSSVSTLDSQTREIYREFERTQKDDPMNSNSNPAAVKRLEQAKSHFVNELNSSEQIASLRRGVLPPGVMQKSFMNRERTMVQSVAVYIPSLSAAASSARDAMKSSRIVRQPGSTGGTSYQNATPGMPSQGPTGQISNDADL